MKHTRRSQLSRAGWLAFAAHLIAGLAMAMILREGLESNPDVTARLRFVSVQRVWWTVAWLTWTLAAATILAFYARFAAVHRIEGLPAAALNTAVLLTIVAVGADWTAQGVEIFVLPGLAGRGDAGGFLAWHRTAVVLTGVLANGLYTLATLLLVWASRRAYPRWIRAAGLGTVIGGATLSAAAWADSASGMVIANVVLVPCLLTWLAGVAVSAARHRGMRNADIP